MGHVSRIFQHSLHTTFTNYLREVRLNNAYDLLLNTDQSVTEIAVNCGFGSTNRMIEVFSQKFGETPGKFRRHSQERETLPLLKEQTQIFDDLLKYAAEAPRPVPPSRPVAREGIDMKTTSPTTSAPCAGSSASTTSTAAPSYWTPGTPPSGSATCAATPASNPPSYSRTCWRTWTCWPPSATGT